jgi:NADH-quinone oxidoreductase subunit N
LCKAMTRNDAVMRPLAVFIGITAAAGSGVALIGQWISVAPKRGGPYLAFSNTVVVDRFGIFLAALVCISVVLVLLLSTGFLQRDDIPGAEYVALMLLSAAGMVTMTSANDLLVMFVALELLSIPLYVLAAFDRRRRTSQEAGLKYFVLGAFASAVFLYGVALMYGTTATTTLLANEVSIASGLRSSLADPTTLFVVAIMLLVVGFGFKVAAAPFHMWTPDVYEGAPTPITAFMASATKVAGFAALLRLLYVTLPAVSSAWQPVLAALAALSLVVGSVAALIQTDVKRMLAYSSIAHAGYILIAVTVGTARGTAAVLFYLAAYAVMVIGSLAVVTLVGPDAGLDRYRGLGRRQPWFAAALTFFLLAQAGVPFTAGFVAKLNVFAAAVSAHWYWLALLGMLAAAVAAFFYLRVVVTMYMSDDDGPDVPAHNRWVLGATWTVIGLCALATLLIGVFPQWLLEMARHALPVLG